MNFQNLEYFITTAKMGNITHAAENLHISQQALSGSISRLEKELGCELFTRRPNFELTYSGKCFFKTASEILDIKTQGETILEDINGNGRGELKIGISHTLGQAVLPMILPEFKKRFPNVELCISESNTKQLEDSLDKCSIDVLVGFLPIMIEGVKEIPLIHDRLYLIISKSLLSEYFGANGEKVLQKFKKTHDIALFKDVPFILLRESERIRSVINQTFAMAHITPKIATETYNTQTAFSLAKNGMGISVCREMYLKSEYTIPGLTADDNVIAIPLFADDVYDTVGIGYIKTRYLSKAAQGFIDITSEKIKSLD